MAAEVGTIAMDLPPLEFRMARSSGARTLADLQICRRYTGAGGLSSAPLTVAL
jgi:hypothetical protein